MYTNQRTNRSIKSRSVNQVVFRFFHSVSSVVTLGSSSFWWCNVKLKSPLSTLRKKGKIDGKDTVSDEGIKLSFEWGSFKTIKSTTVLRQIPVFYEIGAILLKFEMKPS